MNKHLKLVREFHDVFLYPQAEQGTNIRLSEMDIIMRQALLMEEGSELLKAISVIIGIIRNGMPLNACLVN